MTDLNPRTKHFEFLGPPGALFITLAVPTFTYALYFGCSEATGGCPPPSAFDPSILPKIQASLTSLDWWKSLWDTEASLIYLGWYLFCVVSWRVLPGDVVEGTLIRTGVKKKYKMNGEFLFVDVSFWSLRCS